MQVVLGIDAAWTDRHPSGIALAAENAEGWKLIAAEASYQRFHACADKTIAPELRCSGARPVVSQLLASCRALCGRSPDLVAIDMPLSLMPISGRRVSDDAVSRAYGTRKCATHTPSKLRPGHISDDLVLSFKKEGYLLLRKIISTPGVMEVYPHPALVELAKAKERLPYKFGRTGVYWPNLATEERRARLYRQWGEIIALLDREIAGVKDRFSELPLDASRSALKEFEDKLDAVICASVAIFSLKGQARPFGDEYSAIWIPVVETGDEARTRDPNPKKGRPIWTRVREGW
jgi:predicted RNase H-like nuclease